MVSADANKVVSSAKSKIFNREHPGKSFIYIRNIMGPSTEPWGTPLSITRKV